MISVAARLLNRFYALAAIVPDETDVLLGEAGSLPTGILPPLSPPEGAGRDNSEGDMA